MDDVDVTSNGHSGITLVLPSLRALQAANAGKKSKPKPTTDVDQRLKIPRPVKLKPLKEVLTKLITQIKKKDDYAFFIHPVDPTKVPGYADVIKHPMDFGTMSVKVSRGKYRSLDEFTTDFSLVTSNAKTFNPPGSIYHTEADRLETWGLDHIARASAHVIEFETDWNIDIEQDEDGSTSQPPVNIDDEVSTPRDLDGSMAAGSPAPSMTPAPGQVPTQGKRGPRGPYKRQPQTALSEGLDAEGRMPGVKDGVGVFPAGSDWAEVMIALKIKGKRYKTKKERLRFEKEGPPFHSDGSLDYAEMEDPFSVLHVFVPESLVRPQLAPLYPPTSTTMLAPIFTTSGTQLRMHAPMPVTISSDRPCPDLSTLSNVTHYPGTSAPLKKRRHWTIVRNVPARARGKDKDGDATADDGKTTWKTPRDAGPADYGSFAALLGQLAASAVGPSGTAAAEYMYGSEQRLFATLRSTIEHRGVKRKHEETHTAENEGAANEGWDYLRDVVYGGVDGYAYVRSLAEFVAPSLYLEDGDREEDLKKDGGVLPLGVPLARYVEDNLVDTVTRGRHGWLRDVLALDPACATVCGDGPAMSFQVRLAALPGTARTVSSPREWCDEPLDMASLIRVPDELARESMLEGGGEDGERAQIERALAWSAEVFEALGKGTVRVKEEAVDDARIVAMDVDVNATSGLDGDDDDDDAKEDPLMKRLRLNLLALAKRAPLDKIAKLPIELVPEHIRGIVPIA